MIPEEITKAIWALDHEIRWKIVERLLSDEALSYSELQSSVNASNGDLNYHLQILQRGALIQQFAGESFERHNSFYRLSPFGRKILQNLAMSIVQTNVVLTGIAPNRLVGQNYFKIVDLKMTTVE
jgi:hypothetical protein